MSRNAVSQHQTGKWLILFDGWQVIKRDRTKTNWLTWKDLKWYWWVGLATNWKDSWRGQDYRWSTSGFHLKSLSCMSCLYSKCGSPFIPIRMGPFNVRMIFQGSKVGRQVLSLISQKGVSMLSHWLYFLSLQLPSIPLDWFTRKREGGVIVFEKQEASSHSSRDSRPFPGASHTFKYILCSCDNSWWSWLTEESLPVYLYKLIFHFRS